jgi:hypothetical protein
MRSTKLTAARNIAKALRPSEDMIDTSIVRNAELVIAIVEGRLQSGVAAEVGHDAFMSATAGLAALREAREHVVTCHKQLTAVRDAQALDPGQVGCTLKPAGQLSDQVAYLPQARRA